MAAHCAAVGVYEAPFTVTGVPQPIQVWAFWSMTPGLTWLDAMGKLRRLISLLRK